MPQQPLSVNNQRVAVLQPALLNAEGLHMGHGAWGMGAWGHGGMGHGAWGLGHGAWGMGHHIYMWPHTPAAHTAHT